MYPHSMRRLGDCLHVALRAPRIVGLQRTRHFVDLCMDRRVHAVMQLAQDAALISPWSYYRCHGISAGASAITSFHFERLNGVRLLTSW